MRSSSAALASSNEIAWLLDGPDLVFTAAPTTRVDPAKLHALVTRRRSDLRVMPDHRIRTAVRDREPSALFARARQVLVELGAA